ncbi:MAG: flagellar hook protein FlgE [Deltaproteobacteria bacterium]|nr:flagellar hook protein FlgE [Deltaproteobacteria bacterium]
MFALYPGASGLTSMGEAMNVVGSNIANVNTTGYKSSRTNFQDMLATGIKGTAQSMGKGVNIVSVQGNFDQGSMEGTTQVTDMALEGDGFFTIRDKHNRTTYTRAGNFKFDQDGMLVTQNSKQVMVRDVNPITKEITGFPHGAKLIGASDAPRATGDGLNNTGIHLQANLNAESEPPKVQFDPTNVQPDMFNYQTAATVVDERGGEHVVNMVFRRVEDRPPQINPATGQPIPGTGSQNQWQWFVVVPGSEVGAPPENLIAIGGGFLKFAENGKLLETTNGSFVAAGPTQVGPQGQIIPPGPPILVQAPINPDVGVPQVTIPFTNTPQVIGFNFGSGSNPLDPNDVRTGMDGITQFASSNKVRNLEVDGYKSGVLETISVSEDGTIMGYFDNGNIRPMFRMVLTKFVNNHGLQRLGDNEYQEALKSGKPIQGLPNDGTFGAVRSRNLEKSNVDLAQEFVKMIETQRGFQANAKGITTSDEMLADLVAMKR